MFCDANGVEISEWVPTASNTPPGTPLVERHRSYLEDLHVLNRSGSSVQVEDVRIVSSADAPGAPVFTPLQPTPFAVPPNTLVPVTAIVVEYMGAPAGTHRNRARGMRPPRRSNGDDRCVGISAAQPPRRAAADAGALDVGRAIGAGVDNTSRSPTPARMLPPSTASR